MSSTLFQRLQQLTHALTKAETDIEREKLQEEIWKVEDEIAATSEYVSRHEDWDD